MSNAKPIKLDSDELLVLRSMLAHAEELRWTLDAKSDVDLELIDVNDIRRVDNELVTVISPDLVRRALAIAVKAVERAHADFAAELDTVSLHLRANVEFANMPTGHADGPPLHRSRHDIIGAVRYATGAAEQTIRTSALRLADKVPKFKAAWAALDGTKYRGKRRT